MKKLIEKIKALFQKLKQKIKSITIKAKK